MERLTLADNLKLHKRSFTDTEALLRGGLRGQRRVLLVLGVAAVLLVPLLVAALGAQLVEALSGVASVGHEEVPQVQAAHAFTCRHTPVHGGSRNL